MPLITRNEDAPAFPKPAPARITSPQYKGITVDTKYIPVSSLLNSLEGSNWIVNYYRQVVDDDVYLNGQMTNTEAVFQQYWLIKEFELKVSTPLTASQNNDTKEMQLTGSANVHPVLVPNVGDMFLADIGDGREGLFRVTSSETRSIFKDTAHAIDYELVSYSTDDRRADLDSKTVKVLHYVKDNNYYGQDPLIEEEEYYLDRDLKIELQSMTEIYFNAYYSYEFHTLLLPWQDNSTYDDFLVRSVKRLFNTDEHINIRHLRAMNVSDDKTMLAISIWDALLNRDARYLLHVFKTCGLVPAKSFTIDPMMESIYHSGIYYIVYPKDNEVYVDYDLFNVKKDTDPTTDIKLSDNIIPDLTTLLDDITKSKLPYGTNPLIYQCMLDHSYILSPEFYNNTQNQSKFELCVRDYINGQPINKFLLKAFAITQHAWGALEKFYYTPILMAMMKASIKE